MRTFLITCLSFLSVNCFSQKSIDDVLKKYNDNSVDYISVEELAKKDTLILMDTRALAEFQVSHLFKAEWVGYEEFNLQKVIQEYPDKEEFIVVYCSIGVRSEAIGKKLQNAGYTNVKNLYGGIFEWKNKDNTIYDQDENPTNKIHAFDKHWGKLLNKGKKIY